MADAHLNFGIGIVATAPSPATSGTTATLTVGDEILNGIVPFNATVWPGNVQPTKANAEIVRITAINTGTRVITFTRTQEGTSARTIVVGDAIVNSLTAKVLTDIETPPGSNKQVVFNDSSVYGGHSGLTYDKATSALTVAGAVTANSFVGSNVTSVTGTGTLLNPGTSQIALTVTAAGQLSLIYMDIRNNMTTTAGSNFYGILIKTEGDGVDTGAAISIENNGKADGIYLGIKGKAGAVGTNTPSGIGLDLNHGASGENSSTFGGTGIHVWDFSTTHNGDNGATFVKLSKEGDLNNDNRMLYIRGNQRHIELYTPEGTGYDGTKSVLKLFNNTATKLNILASGYIGINKDPAVQLDITDAGEVAVVIANSATTDTRAKLSITGNATNGRGHQILSGKHSGFDGSQNGDGPTIYQFIANNSAGNPLSFAFTTANSTPGQLKLDVTNDGSAGTITGMMRWFANGTTQARMIPRINTTASSATPAINTDTTDQFNITALAAAITSMTSSLTGTPIDGQKLFIRIKDNGTARAITWGTSFTSSGIATLPTTTIISKTHMIGFMYDSVVAKWVCIAVDATGY